MPVQISPDLCELSATELAVLIRSKKVSPVEVVQSVIDRVARLNPAVNAFMTVCPDLALEAAHRSEDTLMKEGADALGALAGIPLSIKDLTPYAGVRTTYGLAAHADTISEEDAPISERVRAAQAAMIGKVSTPAYGWLGVTESKVHGTTNNPWKPGHTVGGSSGGSAAAVAAGFGPLSTGSDGGGSIRVPAALCGVVGYKCSHGRIPRGAESRGFETVDELGPLARTVADAALLFGIMAGPDHREPNMLPAEDYGYLKDFRPDEARKLKIAWSPDLGHGPVDPEVAAITAAAANHFADVLGAAVTAVEIDIPDPNEYFVGFWSPQMELFKKTDPAFATEHLRRYPSLGEMIKDNCGLSAAEYWDYVMSTRQKTFNGLSRALLDHDILLTPTTPVAAWPHNGELGPAVIDDIPVKHRTIDWFRFTEPPSHSGLPAISIPCGFTSKGLPVGLQIIGRQRADRTVLRAAAAYEATTDWHLKRPSIAG